MDQNFDSAVRLTEALLPLLRRSAPSAIVNVASIAGRVGRAEGRRLQREQVRAGGLDRVAPPGGEPHGVHVGLVLPGFVATEGFPQEH